MAYDATIAAITLAGSALTTVATACVLVCFVVYHKNQRSLRHALVLNLAISGTRPIPTRLFQLSTKLTQHDRLHQRVGKHNLGLHLHARPRTQGWQGMHLQRLDRTALGASNRLLHPRHQHRNSARDPPKGTPRPSLRNQDRATLRIRLARSAHHEYDGDGNGRDEARERQLVLDFKGADRSEIWPYPRLALCRHSCYRWDLFLCVVVCESAFSVHGRDIWFRLVESPVQELWVGENGRQAWHGKSAGANHHQSTIPC